MLPIKYQSYYIACLMNLMKTSLKEIHGGVWLILRTEDNIVVDCVYSIDEVCTQECRGHIIERIGIG